MGTRVRRLLVIVALALLTPALLAGCTRPRPSQVGPGKPKAPALPTSTTLENTTVKLADPAGKWTFDAVAKTATTAGAKGPYDMTEADGVCRRPGEPPAYLHARRLHLDQQRQHVTLEGAVRVVSGGLTVEGDRIEYDLKTGKVVGAPRTNWTFDPKAAEAARTQMAVRTGGKQ
jgi:LptA/(LptD N-terminal domain) LPS transport protein